jgi:CHAT domain-containing protein
MSLDYLASLMQSTTASSSFLPNSGTQPSLEKLVSIADPGHEVPADLIPWVKLVDAYHFVLTGESEKARTSWIEIAKSASEPTVGGLAWLGAAFLGRAGDEKPDSHYVHAWIESARQEFRSANLSDGVAIADIREADLSYREENFDAARRHAADARDGFRKTGNRAGLVESELMTAQVEIAAGQRKAATEAIVRAEEIQRLLTGGTEEPVWKLSDKQSNYLTAQLGKIPSLRSEKQPPAAVADARAFHEWARGTGNPFVEIASLRVLAQSLMAEGHWNDALIYGLQASDVFRRLSAQTTLSERLLEAARLDYRVLAKEGVAAINGESFSALAGYISNFLKAAVPAFQKVEDLDDDEIEEANKRIAELKKDGSEADRHRLLELTLARTDRKRIIREVDLKFDALSKFLHDLDQLQAKASFSGGVSDDTEDDDDDKRSVPPAFLAYMRTIEKAVISADPSLADEAARTLLKAIDGGEEGAEKSSVPMVLGGFGGLQSGNADESSDSGGDALAARGEAIRARMEAVPWLRGVRWGVVVAEAAKAGFNDAASTAMLGNSPEDSVRNASDIYSGLYATQVAASLAGDRSFISLPGLEAGKLSGFVGGNPSLKKWAGVMGDFGAASWLVSLQALPIQRLHRDKNLRRIVQSILTTALQEADDDDFDDDIDDDQDNATATMARNFQSETWLRNMPALLLKLAGQKENARKLETLMLSVQVELSSVKKISLQSSAFGAAPTVPATQLLVALNLGEYYIADGNYQAAAAQFRRIRGTGAIYNYQIEYALALCYRHLKRPREEQSSLAAAVSELQSIRSSMPTQNLALRLESIRQIVMEEYLNSLKRNGSAARMAQAIWNYRQSSLVPAAVASTARSTDAVELDSLRDLYDAVSSDRLATVGTAEIRAELREFDIPEDRLKPGDPALNGINVAMDAVIDQMSFSDAIARTPRKPAATGVATTQVHPLVKNDELLVFYFVGSRGVYSTTFDGAGVVRQHYRAIDPDRLQKLCDDFRDGLAAGSSREQASAAIYDVLLADVTELAGKRHLRVLGDGSLQAIPFAALRENADSPYLVERMSVAYVYGAERSRELGKSGLMGKVLVVANPTRDLSGSEDEARAIGESTAESLLPPLIGSLATTEALRKALREADLIHFSAHAERNASQPNFSFIRLAQGDRIYSYDLANLDFRGKKVFLGACDTLSANAVLGQDIYGLAGAFIGGGASSVVATLWPIDSEASAEFAKLLYGYLKHGANEPDALAQADKDFIARTSNSTFSDPVFWAGFSFVEPLLFGSSSAGSRH